MLLPRAGPVLGIVAPVFALVALGALLGRRGLVSSEGRRDLHRIVFYVAMPAQLIVQLGGSDLQALVPAAVAVAWLTYAIGFAATWLATRGLEPASRGSVLSGAVRSNAALIGVPMALLLAEHLPAPAAGTLRATAVLLLGALVPLFNIGSVVGFLAPRHGLRRDGMRRAFADVITNPLLLACLAGFAAALVRPHLSVASASVLAVPTRALALLGSLAVPASLLLAGTQLDGAVVRDRRALIGAVAATKLVLMPLLGWTLCSLAGLDGPCRAAVVIILAAPTAMVAVPMAAMLGGDVELMSAEVVASTALAPLSMAAWLAVLGAGTS